LGADESLPSRIASLADPYQGVEGILTYRGGHWRRAGFGGKVSASPTDIQIAWEYHTDYDATTTSLGTWGGGNGWTGQPLYIHWPDSVYNRILAENQYLTPDFGKRELIIGSLCGRIYFLDPDNGKPTRQSIDAGNPIKGTMMLDPLMNGNLYVGQGVPNRQPFGMITADIFHNVVKLQYPPDNEAYRQWNAYDSSPIRVGDFVFRIGENGIIYKFYTENIQERLQAKMRYRVQGAKSTPGAESSMAVYKNYGYFSDNNGNVICLSLNTLEPVWHYFNVDDSDATIVIEEQNGTPYIYTASEVDKQHGRGAARLVKLNGLTGAEIWTYEMMLNQVFTADNHFDGGFYATPLLGEGNCKHLLFINRVDNLNGTQGGHFIALNRKNGKLVYEKKLDCYSWSSPVGIMGPDNHQYVFTADTHGFVYLFDGLTGDMICKRLVGTNFESSPIVIGNRVYIGSRGNQIFCLELR